MRWSSRGKCRRPSLAKGRKGGKGGKRRDRLYARLQTESQQLTGLKRIGDTIGRPTVCVYVPDNRPKDDSQIYGNTYVPTYVRSSNFPMRWPVSKCGIVCHSIDAPLLPRSFPRIEEGRPNTSIVCLTVGRSTGPVRIRGQNKLPHCLALGIRGRERKRKRERGHKREAGERKRAGAIPVFILHHQCGLPTYLGRKGRWKGASLTCIHLSFLFDVRALCHIFALLHSSFIRARIYECLLFYHGRKIEWDVDMVAWERGEKAAAGRK